MCLKKYHVPAMGASLPSSMTAVLHPQSGERDDGGGWAWGGRVSERIGCM